MFCSVPAFDAESQNRKTLGMIVLFSRCALHEVLENTRRLFLVSTEAMSPLSDETSSRLFQYILLLASLPLLAITLNVVRQLVSCCLNQSVRRLLPLVEPVAFLDPAKG